jgi:tripartite-type tricarboxylate transporter receptor subunit TctC
MKRVISLLILLLLAAPAAAQEFPGKPINMIVDFAPAGATDA